MIIALALYVITLILTFIIGARYGAHASERLRIRSLVRYCGVHHPSCGTCTLPFGHDGYHREGLSGIAWRRITEPVEPPPTQAEADIAHADWIHDLVEAQMDRRLRDDQERAASEQREAELEDRYYLDGRTRCPSHDQVRRLWCQRYLGHAGEHYYLDEHTTAQWNDETEQPR